VNLQRPLLLERSVKLHISPFWPTAEIGWVRLLEDKKNLREMLVNMKHMYLILIRIASCTLLKYSLRFTLK